MDRKGDEQAGSTEEGYGEKMENILFYPLIRHELSSSVCELRVLVASKFALLPMLLLCRIVV